MSSHPANSEAVWAWDDEGDATGYCFGDSSGVGIRIPTYAAASMNGLGTLRFDGIDNRFMINDDAFTSIPTPDTFISTSAATVFVVFAVRGDGSNASDIYLNSAVFGISTAFFGLAIKTSGGVTTAEAWGATLTGVAVTISQNTTYVAMVRQSGGTLQVRLNDDGGLNNSTSSGNIPNINVGDFRLGQCVGAYAQVDIGEIAIYNAAVTGTDELDAWSYFLTKWVSGGGASGQPTTRHWGGIPHMGTQKLRGGHRGGPWGRTKDGIYVPRREAA